MVRSLAQYFAFRDILLKDAAERQRQFLQAMVAAHVESLGYPPELMPTVHIEDEST